MGFGSWGQFKPRVSLVALLVIVSVLMMSSTFGAGSKDYQTITYSGVVTDEHSGAPVKEAVVSLYIEYWRARIHGSVSEGFLTVSEVKTDPQGRYEFDAIEIDPNKIEFHDKDKSAELAVLKDGYEHKMVVLDLPLKQKVDDPPNKDLTVFSNIALREKESMFDKGYDFVFVRKLEHVGKNMCLEELLPNTLAAFRGWADQLTNEWDSGYYKLIPLIKKSCGSYNKTYKDSE